MYMLWLLLRIPPAQFAMRAKELERSMSFPTAEN